MQHAALENLLSHEAQVLSSAEAHIATRLAPLAGSVPAGPARDILTEQVRLSESRIPTLQEVVDKVAGAGGLHMECIAINALLEEVVKATQANLHPDALKAEISLGVLRIKQYQLAGYRAVQAYATALGITQDVQPLQATRTADEKTAKSLSEGL
jgi:ferritin-like metal-binding protein YciE